MNEHTKRRLDLEALVRQKYPDAVTHTVRCTPEFTSFAPTYYTVWPTPNAEVGVSVYYQGPDGPAGYAVQKQRGTYRFKSGVDAAYCLWATEVEAPNNNAILRLLARAAKKGQLREQ